MMCILRAACAALIVMMSGFIGSLGSEAWPLVCGFLAAFVAFIVLSTGFPLPARKPKRVAAVLYDNICAGMITELFTVYDSQYGCGLVHCGCTISVLLPGGECASGRAERWWPTSGWTKEQLDAAFKTDKVSP